MIQKLRFSLISLVAILTMFVSSQVAQATPQHLPSNQGSSDVHFSFAARVNQETGPSTSLVGGLALQINQAKGTLKGTLNLPNNRHLPVTGTLSYGQMTIFIFLDRHQNNFMKAIGTFNGTNEYSGNCWEYNGTQVNSGSWSASQIVQSDTMIAYAYHLTVIEGPYAGLQMDAAMIIDKKTGVGNAYQANGSVTPLTFSRAGSYVTIVFQLPYGLIVTAQGTISGSSMHGTATSFAGGGIWNADKFDL